MSKRISETETEVGIRDLRREIADLVEQVMVRGEVAWITNYGRRVAALVPVPLAEHALGPSGAVRVTVNPTVTAPRPGEPSTAQLLTMLYERGVLTVEA